MDEVCEGADEVRQPNAAIKKSTTQIDNQAEAAQLNKTIKN